MSLFKEVIVVSGSLVAIRIGAGSTYEVFPYDINDAVYVGNLTPSIEEALERSGLTVKLWNGYGFRIRSKSSKEAARR